MSFYALIMAGGGGTRLWPVSRKSQPKQSLRLVGDRTMFQHAVDRIAPIFQPENILIVTGENHVASLRDQEPGLPDESFVLEPMGRGTAPAIGLGAIRLQNEPDSVMVVLTADHFIQDVEKFRRALQAAQKAAEAGHIVTLGIRPSFPSTGYGYIKQGERLTTIDGFPVFRAERFTEKPEPEPACQMVESGLYSWNSGMFVWRIDRILAEFARQMPSFYDQLAQIGAVVGTPTYDKTLSRIWPEVTPETIDYGVMEGAEDVVVIPVDIGWSDVGNWSSMRDVLPADEEGNVVVGDHLAIDTANSIIYNDGGRLIATIGLEDVIVVNTENAVLVCPREREQDVRDMVHRLRKLDRKDVL